MAYIGNTPGVSSQRAVQREVIAGSPKSVFIVTSGYSLGYVDVIVNGSQLDEADFTAADGVTVTLAQAAAVGDIVRIIAWLPRGLSDGYLKSEVDARVGTTNSIGFRNRIINGDMRIDQRNSGASVTVATGSNVYTLDRWQVNKDTAGITLTAQQSSVAPARFKNSLLLTASVGDSPTALQYLCFQQKIEGLNASDLEFGTANASAVTLSFCVRSSIAGAYAIVLKNSANDRSYVATYTINTANTFEQKTITIAGDTAGTWLSTNGIGIRVGFDLGSGSGYNTTAGAWQTGDFFRTSGTVNWGSTSGATFYITGVQLEAGTVATPFERRDYGRELLMCQRYYCHSNGIFNAPDVNTPSYVAAGLASDIEDAALTSVMFPSVMRATPAMIVGRMYSFDGSKYKTITSISPSAQGIGYLNHDSGNSGAGYVLGRPYKFSWIASAEL